MLKASGHISQYAFQLLALFVIILSVLTSRPLDDDKQWLLPNKIWLTRLVDPLVEKIGWDADNTIPNLTFLATHKNKDSKNVHDFIQKYTLTDDVDKVTFEEISKNPLSPITRVMIMMGCYGSLNYDAKGKSLELLNSDSNAVLLNILLNVYERASFQSLSNSQMVLTDQLPKNDHSVCSCLKDFASPLAMKANTDTDTPYVHDTCTVQNVVDYTNAYKNDVLKRELDMYFKNFETKYFRITDDANYNASNAWKNVSVSVVKNDYPEFRVFMDMFESKIRTFNTLEHVKTYLDDYVSTKMFSHNKLRTPKFNTMAEFDKVPLEMNIGSYELYIKKYRSAYQVCSAMGVPNYKVQPITKVIASDYGRIGVVFLLLAATVGFSTVYHRKLYEEYTEKGTDSPNTEYFMDALSKFIKLLLVIVLIVYLSIISKNSLDEKMVAEEENSVKFVIALMWIFALVSLAFNLYDNKSWVSKDTFKGPDLVFKQIGQDVCIIVGLASLAVAFRLQRGDSDEYVFLSSFSIFIVIGLLQHMSNLVRMIQQHIHEKLLEVKSNTETIVTQDANGDMISKVTNNSKDAIFQIAYNRVIVTVIIIFGLIAYLTLATSTIQVWTPDIMYSEQHTRIFAICAFFILTAYDIFFEILSLKYKQAASEQQHPRKMMWTSWTIIVSVLLLNAHQFFALCYDRQKPTDETCEILNYAFNL